MAEELHIAQGSKEERYALLYKQIAAVTENESDTIANMANVAAMIHATFGFWWTGFYRVVGQELVLGPFQGKPACIEIAVGKGVCGTAVAQASPIVVPDVHEFPGHIACDSASNSEIVLPIFKNGALFGVLDMDRPSLAYFTEDDKEIACWGEVFGVEVRTINTTRGESNILTFSISSSI